MRRGIWTFKLLRERNENDCSQGSVWWKSTNDVEDRAHSPGAQPPGSSWQLCPLISGLPSQGLLLLPLPSVHRLPAALLHMLGIWEVGSR
jgi:hypothetical protein